MVKVDEQGRTNKKNIYAIGDIVAGASLAHKASYEGKVAAEAIAGKPSTVDYVAMPAVCYTDPELGTAGLTEKDAKKKMATRLRFLNSHLSQMVVRSPLIKLRDL